MTAAIENTTTIATNYVDDNDETNYDDDVDDSATYNADDSNVRIIP